MTPQGLPGLVVFDVNADLKTGQRVRMKRASAARQRLGKPKVEMVSEAGGGYLEALPEVRR